jgi:hypothetical protein
MTQHFSRITSALVELSEAVGEIEMLLADGCQPEDEPGLRVTCRSIKREILELEDVELDIIAVRRTLTAGRHAVMDDRFRARQNALNKAKAAQYSEYEAA